MKVVVYSYAYLRPSETFIKQQVEGLGAIVVCREIDLTASGSVDVYTIGDVSVVDRLSAWCQRKLLRIIKGKYPAYWLSRKEKKRFVKLLEDIRPDIVLTQFGPGLIDVGALCFQKKVPVVAHFHGYDLSSLLNYNTYIDELKTALQYASYGIVVNKYMQNTLIKLCPKLPVDVIPYGYPKIPSIKSREKTIKTVLVVGRLVDKKDPAGLLTVAKLLDDREVVGQLIVVGDGAQLDELRAKALKISQDYFRVSFVGSKTRNEVFDLLKISDVFLQLSRVAKNGDQEGWPNSIAEAMSAGLPVVATISPGIIDQVINEKSGKLVPVNGYLEAADALQAYIENVELSTLHGEEGVRVSATFPVEIAIQKVRQLLLDTI